MAIGPRIRERERRHVGERRRRAARSRATPTGSPCAQVAILSISFARPWRSSSPTYSIRSAARVRLGLHARPAGTGRRPRRRGLAWRRRRSSRSPPFAHAFAIGASFFTSSPTSASTVSGAGAAQVASRRPRRRPPSSRRSADGSDPSSGRRRPSRRRGARRRTGCRSCRALTTSAPLDLERRRDLDRLGHEARPQALDRRLDLRPVAARDQVRGLERGPFAHSAYRTGRSVADRQRAAVGLEHDRGRSRRCGRPRARDGRGVPPACRRADGRSRCGRRPRSRPLAAGASAAPRRGPDRTSRDGRP